MSCPQVILSQILALFTYFLCTSREQGWVAGPDDALTWDGPDTSLTLQVGDKAVRLPSAAEREADRRVGLIDLITRGMTDSIRVTTLGIREGEKERSLTVHPLALTIPGANGFTKTSSKL